MVCSTVLAFESVVLFLMAGPMVYLGGVQPGVAIATSIGLAVLALVIIGLLRTPVGLVAGSLLQVVAIGMGFVITLMFVLGSVFALLWVVAVLLGRKVERAEAARADSGAAGGSGGAADVADEATNGARGDR